MPVLMLHTLRKSCNFCHKLDNREWVGGIFYLGLDFNGYFNYIVEVFVQLLHSNYVFHSFALMVVSMTSKLGGKTRR